MSDYLVTTTRVGEVDAHKTIKCVNRRRNEMSIIVLVALGAVAFLGVLPIWPHSADWGYISSGGLGFLILILAILNPGRSAGTAGH